MQNWAKTLTFSPSSILAPNSLEELQQITENAAKKNKTIRVMGSGHSWTGLIETSQWLLHLDNYQGVMSVDRENQIVHAKAGTRLYRFVKECFEQGLSFPNQGDIEKQSLAGATSTGTHGTGIHLQSLSNLIEELTIVTEEGLKVVVDKLHPWFNAARLSLGSFGILAEMKLKMRENYRLKVNTFVMPMNEVMDRIDTWLVQHRHVGLFYFPVGDWTMVKIMDETQDEVNQQSGLWHKINEKVLEDWVFEAFNAISAITKKYKFIDVMMKRFVIDRELVDWSYRAFPSHRSIKFREMEYNLDAKDFKKAFALIKKSIKENNFQTLFPIEIRFVKSDQIWLSPAYQRESVYFAFHTYVYDRWEQYFKTMENIMKEINGRPHWGKWHTLSGNDLEQRYPRFHEFKHLREKIDPKGRFLNHHLKNILKC